MSFYSNTMPFLASKLLSSIPVHIGEWQSKDVSRIPQMSTFEDTDVIFTCDVPDDSADWAGWFAETPTSEVSDMNVAWAEEHFQERVSGIPHNPPPSHERWPWSRHNGNHQDGVKHEFSHTYPERIWPARKDPSFAEGRTYSPIHGIRFDYGNLSDVVDLLVRSPLTRQAYLPIWFPEDTGAVHRQRVPCTLGYHFMIRGGRLSCRYYMRSCDLIRHFPDDVYLAGRLMQWVTDRVNTLTNNGSYIEGVDRESLKLHPGTLTMYISSLHAFVGDEYKLKQIARRANARADR